MWSWKLMMVILPPMLLCPTSTLNQSTPVISNSPKQPHMMFESNKCRYRLIPSTVAFQSDLHSVPTVKLLLTGPGALRNALSVAEHTSHGSVSFCMNRYSMAQNDSCHTGKTEHHNSFWSCLSSEQWIVPYNTEVCQKLPGIFQLSPLLFPISFFTVL